MVPRLMNMKPGFQFVRFAMRCGVSVALFAALLASPALDASEAPEPYLKVERPNGDVSTLKVAARQFKRPKGDGPILWLTGVTHVGEPDYYGDLQRHLDAQSIVLFEGVGGGPTKPPRKKEADGGAKPGDRELHSVQTTLADSLGLVFQLETIDYTRPHFVNSDLSIAQIRRILEGDGKKKSEGSMPAKSPDRKQPSVPRKNPKSGAVGATESGAVGATESGAGRKPVAAQSKEPASKPLPEKRKELEKTGDSNVAEAATSARETGASAETEAGDGEVEGKDKDKQAAEQFDRMLSVMDGSSALGAMMDTMLRYIGTSPKLKAITRLMFIEVLGGLKGDLANTAAMPLELQEVMKALIYSRNEQVVEDLRAQMDKKTPPASISVFYGAGHMDDLERRIREDLGYEPIKDEWFTAFSVNTREAGVNVAEKALVRYIINIQMQVLNTPASGTKAAPGDEEARGAQGK